MRPSDPFIPRLQLPKGWDRVQVEARWPGALDEPVNRDWCGEFYIDVDGDDMVLSFEDDVPAHILPCTWRWDPDLKTWSPE